MFKFDDNSKQFFRELDKGVENWLEESSAEIEAQTKRNSAVGIVGGGRTKSLWQHKVDMKNGEAVIGNTTMNALWEELGTGEYSEDFDNESTGVYNDSGRKGGWYIPIGEGENNISMAVVEAYHFPIKKGKDGTLYAFTFGKHAKHSLFKAGKQLEGKILRRLEKITDEL